MLIKNFKGKRLVISSTTRSYVSSYQKLKIKDEENIKKIKDLEEKMKISLKDTAEYKKLEEEFKNIQEEMKKKEEKIKGWNIWTKFGIIVSIFAPLGTLWYLKKTEKEKKKKRRRSRRKKKTRRTSKRVSKNWCRSCPNFWRKAPSFILKGRNYK